MTYIDANDSETCRLEFWAASAKVTVMSTDTVKHDNFYLG